MAAGIDGEAQLGAHAVGAGYQDGLSIPIQRDLHERAEAADAAEHLGAHGAPDRRLDPLDQRVAGVDVDARLG